VDRLGAAVGTAASLPAAPGRPPWQTLPVLLHDPTRRDALVRDLADRGVEARTYYSPGLHRASAFGATEPLPVTDAIAARIVCLPVYSDLVGDELEELATDIAEAFSRA
jgi:dTDP-4-amino-4,6-dideoxygalactose transaminase